MKNIKLILPFIKVFMLWLKVRYWLKVCKDPMKLMVLNVTEDYAIIAFSMIGWWTPKKKGFGAKL